MLDVNFEDKLQKVIDQLKTNFQRLNFAYSSIENVLPLNVTSVNELKDGQISYIDQYIFRFAKIQDLMGEKLFPLILEALGEDTRRMAFIDKLNRLETLGVINDQDEWLKLRKLRNEVSHEYPVIDNEAVSALNSLFENKKRITVIFNSCINFLRERNLA